MDESRARIRCPGEEDVVVPTDVKELYIASPENRKSIIVIKTIITDGRDPLPLFIIAPS
jgi:hypothetical protein